VSETRHQPNPAWADHVRKLVDQAPPLTPEQIDKLAILLQVQPPPGERRRAS